MLQLADFVLVRVVRVNSWIVLRVRKKAIHELHELTRNAPKFSSSNSTRYNPGPC